MKHKTTVIALQLFVFLCLISLPIFAQDTKVRVIVFGAHPDDPEIGTAGVASLWAAKGHLVKLVAVTNGDIGHWKESGGELFRRRKAEVERTAKANGYTVELLDNHDGELLPTLENRKKIVKLIREWKADIVISHRPNDYHPDHRYTGVLVQDAAYMVTVPNFVPETPHLTKNPVFLYSSDRFDKPNPFSADIVVDIDSVMEKKLDGLLGMVSQFYEGGANGYEALMNKDPEFVKKRWAEVRARFVDRQKGIADKYRNNLVEWYGKDRAAKIQHAEAFEICEYGNKPSKAEIKRLFPFFE